MKVMCDQSHNCSMIQESHIYSCMIAKIKIDLKAKTNLQTVAGYAA